MDQMIPWSPETSASLSADTAATDATAVKPIEERELDKCAAGPKGDAKSFLNNLLTVMLNASVVDVDPEQRTEALKTSVFQGIGSIGSLQKEVAIRSRFAMGEHDERYLRSSVMPLQAAMDTGDEVHLAGHLMDQLSAVSTMGVLEASEKEYKVREGAIKKKLDNAKRVVEYLYSIEEVKAFVDAEVKVMETMEAMEAMKATEATKEEEKVALALLMLFDRPMQHVEQAMKTTVGTSTANPKDSKDLVRRYLGAEYRIKTARCEMAYDDIMAEEESKVKTADDDVVVAKVAAMLTAQTAAATAAAAATAPAAPSAAAGKFDLGVLVDDDDDDDDDEAPLTPEEEAQWRRLEKAKVVAKNVRKEFADKKKSAWRALEAAEKISTGYWAPSNSEEFTTYELISMHVQCQQLGSSSSSPTPPNGYYEYYTRLKPATGDFEESREVSTSSCIAYAMLTDLCAEKAPYQKPDTYLKLTNKVAATAATAAPNEPNEPNENVLTAFIKAAEDIPSLPISSPRQVEIDRQIRIQSNAQWGDDSVDPIKHAMDFHAANRLNSLNDDIIFKRKVAQWVPETARDPLSLSTAESVVLQALIERYKRYERCRLQSGGSTNDNTPSSSTFASACIAATKIKQLEHLARTFRIARRTVAAKKDPLPTTREMDGNTGNTITFFTQPFRVVQSVRDGEDDLRLPCDAGLVGIKVTGGEEGEAEAEEAEEADPQLPLQPSQAIQPPNRDQLVIVANQIAAYLKIVFRNSNVMAQFQNDPMKLLKKWVADFSRGFEYPEFGQKLLGLCTQVLRKLITIEPQNDTTRFLRGPETDEFDNLDANDLETTIQSLSSKSFDLRKMILVIAVGMMVAAMLGKYNLQVLIDTFQENLTDAGNTSNSSMVEAAINFAWKIVTTPSHNAFMHQHPSAVSPGQPMRLDPSAVDVSQHGDMIGGAAMSAAMSAARSAEGEGGGGGGGGGGGDGDDDGGGDGDGDGDAKTYVKTEPLEFRTPYPSIPSLPSPSSTLPTLPTLPTMPNAAELAPHVLEAIVRSFLVNTAEHHVVTKALSDAQAKMDEHIKKHENRTLSARGEAPEPDLSEDKDFNDGGDYSARKRRRAVYDDALREALLSGDRLYAFARQMSGTMHEGVDAVSMIDEGVLQRHQRLERERRARLTNSAAAEHLSLVKDVFSAVLRESALTLAIGEDGNGIDGGEFKVVSGTLRRQLLEASKSTGSEGFFANSLKMQNLLATGQGEMTLTQLFARLQQAGQEMQRAALAAPLEAEVPISLDFLSAPRNSLMLRWKTEALAAVNTAFYKFSAEWKQSCGYRCQPTAFELMEGRDAALSNAFAEFCGYTLVHSRIFSSSSAGFLSLWPAKMNMLSLKVSLHRLLTAAQEYRKRQPNPPNFADVQRGREIYFRQ